MRRHSELWFVALLTVVLPALVLVSAQATMTSATASMVSAEKSRITALHDAARDLLLSPVPLPTQLTREFLREQPGLIATRLISDSEDTTGLISVDLFATSTIVVSERAEFVGLVKGRPDETFVFEFLVAGKRTWYTYRSLTVTGNLAVLETVHDMSLLDDRLEQRLYETFALVAFVIIVIICFAYWTARQIDYRGRFEEVTEQLRMQERFTSTVVHELRAPLTAMRGYASMIEEDTTIPVHIRNHAEQIKRSTVRLAALVSDYLEVTRLSSGAATLVRAPLDVVAVVQEVVKELEPMAHEKHLALSVRSTHVPITIPSNQKLLVQALTNLVSNAIKYTSQGHVEVVVVDETYAVEVRIKDTGFGISADDQKRLFAPFSRVGDSASRAVTGSGLGMWITKLLVEQLGGTIGVESIKGVGTHVVMCFKKR